MTDRPDQPLGGAFHTYLGYDARIFDGSFQEWSGTERLPVILPAGRR